MFSAFYLPYWRAGLTLRGETRWLREWARDPAVNVHRIPVSVLHNRLIHPGRPDLDWPPERAFATPVRHRPRRQAA